MFNRSAERGRLFGGITTALDNDPAVYIFNKKYTIGELIDSQTADRRYIELGVVEKVQNLQGKLTLVVRLL